MHKYFVLRTNVNCILTTYDWCRCPKSLLCQETWVSHDCGHEGEELGLRPFVFGQSLGGLSSLHQIFSTILPVNGQIGFFIRQTNYHYCWGNEHQTKTHITGTIKGPKYWWKETTGSFIMTLSFIHKNVVRKWKCLPLIHYWHTEKV